MGRFGPEGWSGLALLAVCVAVGWPVVAGSAETTVPRAWWIALFAVMVIALVVVAVIEHRGSRVVLAAYGVTVVASCAVVLTAPGSGLLPVLLVVVAAIGTYVVPLPVVFVVIGLNTVVVAWGTIAAGGPIRAEVAIVALFYLLIQVAAALSSVAMIREQRMRRELAEAHVELRSASVLLAESSRAQERLRIARELHDLMGHQLTVLTLELETARHQDGDRAREHVERADRVARELLGDARETVGQMRSHAPDLRESLATVVRDLPGLEARVEVDDDVRTDEEQTATLVRGVQEIVTNTIRHAGASRLEIGVRLGSDGAVELTATDDGNGSPQVTVGNGLRGLTERVASLGGEVRFDGRDGFRVTARVPAR